MARSTCKGKLVTQLNLDCWCLQCTDMQVCMCNVTDLTLRILDLIQLCMLTGVCTHAPFYLEIVIANTLKHKLTLSFP